MRGSSLAKEIRKVFDSACGFDDRGKLKKIVENKHGNRLALTRNGEGRRGSRQA